MKDPRLEKQLTEDGFVVIRGFMDGQTVSELTRYNEANQPTFIHNSIINTVWHSTDADYKARTIKKVVDAYSPICERYFIDYKLVGGSFIIKPPHGQGESQPHIDFGVVDERVYRSFSLWVSLVPTTMQNGALHVLKGCHSKRQVFRGPNIPDQTVGIRDWLWENSEILLMQPGDAVLYDQRAVHGSRSNFTDVPRVAASCAITSASADMVLYFWDDRKKKVCAYRTDPAFFLANYKGQLPDEGLIIGEWDYDLASLTLQDLGVAQKKTNSIIGRMANLFRR